MFYLIPTPIWNTKDITLRALDLFQELKHFICEDTRNFKKLLWIYKINYSDKFFYSLTSFTEQHKLNNYIEILKSNDVWLVSDAGTPWLSDPWKTMIQLCNQNNLKFTVLPWATALVPAIVWSGFDTSKFVFVWFLPKKKWKQTMIKEIIKSDYPTFFYESVHRIAKILEEFKSLWFTGKVSISREISKMHEQIITDNIDTVLDLFKSNKIVLKGEFVVGVYKL